MNKKKNSNEMQTLPSGDLPEGWILSNLGKISSKPQYGWTTKANHESGNVKLLRTTDITSGQINWTTVPYCSKEPDDLNKYLLKPGDIVISRAGSVGVSYLLTDTDNAVFASYLIRFRPNEPVDKKFVYYYLKSPDYWKAISKSTLGIAVPNVNATKLAKVKIPIAPENEQKSIVAEIEKQFSRLDEAVDNLKRVKANLKRYKASVLKAAVEGKLTEEWRKSNPDVESADTLLQRILAERRKKWEEAELARLRERAARRQAKMKAKGKKPNDDKWKKKYKEPIAPDLTQLTKLPKSWIGITFSTLINKIKRGPSMKCNQEEKGIRYITSGNLENGILRLDLDQKYLDGFNNIEKCLLKPGDFILNCVNSLEQIAKSAVFESRHGKAIVGFNNYALELETKWLFPQYANIFCQSEHFKKQIYFLIKRAVNQVSFATRELDFITVALPPMKEQEKIVLEVERSISIMNELEIVVSLNEKRVDKLRQSILKKAFSGKLISQNKSQDN